MLFTNVFSNLTATLATTFIADQNSHWLLSFLLVIDNALAINLEFSEALDLPLTHLD
jgi:hypothetical protein